MTYQSGIGKGAEGEPLGNTAHIGKKTALCQGITATLIRDSEQQSTVID